ncbi:MAG: NAD(P)/FAD-dependent oxidoreductase [SAR86 cluster bacterium]|uniref:NAD(P)/FAD-dependent oxidoreductase n=1 Tax=SAR86 cluster bacterium TaxID=2030880 RepID=A0A972VZN5_9GAMM|nr:NAD(P)/FAD-dependent oxidoreductase [SAR86 cluster bacterium]
MLRLDNIKLPLDHADAELLEAICSRLEISVSEVIHFTVFKRSYDARNKSNIQLIYQVNVQLGAELEKRLLGKQSILCRPAPDTRYQFVAMAEGTFPSEAEQRPIVIGFGPCGILSALLLAQMGLRPIVLERGSDVRKRTKDTWGFWRKGQLNTESNVQFGEGGAGTFSDGKLYSQVKDKRHLGRKVLDEFVKAGAPPEILFLSKPHIGTFKLVTMVERMRAEIVRLGGEIRFDSKVEHLLHEPLASSELNNRDTRITEGENESALRQVTGIRLADGTVLNSRHIILAIGHSARDTFSMLLEEGVYIEPKPFSIGFRIEHPQSVIDRARFGNRAGHAKLGAADYKLVHHCANGRSVYSFCMCPGGTVVAATSEEGHVVTNGMSQYSRNERNANSAIVVGIDPETDYPGHVLAGIDLQRKLEKLAYTLGGSDYCAPAQLVGDFLADEPSTALASAQPSYKPGIKLGNLSEALPQFAIDAIREAIPVFDRQIKGFAMPEALLTGVETRTSSPICIKRGSDYQNLTMKGLYPAGEGAGYAGGILSAGIDGIKVAEALATSLRAPTGSDVV